MSLRGGPPTLLLVCAALAPAAHAQQDMVGPDWLKLLLAGPKVLLYGLGELALYLTGLFAVLAILSWIASATSSRVGRHLPSARISVVLMLFAAAPGLIYWLDAPDEPPNPALSYRSTTTPDRHVDRLAPPPGIRWPQETGYLALPQGAHGGTGVIVVSGSASTHRVYVKLCEAARQPCQGLRHAFLQKHTSFEFRELPAGTYEVRYLPIDRPIIGGRSQPIRISGYIEDPHEVRITDSPVLDSKYAVVGIDPKDF